MCSTEHTKFQLFLFSKDLKIENAKLLVGYEFQSNLLNMKYVKTGSRILKFEA